MMIRILDFQTHIITQNVLVFVQGKNILVNVWFCLCSNMIITRSVKIKDKSLLKTVCIFAETNLTFFFIWKLSYYSEYVSEIPVSAFFYDVLP